MILEDLDFMIDLLRDEIKEYEDRYYPYFRTGASYRPDVHDEYHEMVEEYESMLQERMCMTGECEHPACQE